MLTHAWAGVDNLIGKKIEKVEVISSDPRLKLDATRYFNKWIGTEFTPRKVKNGIAEYQQNRTAYLVKVTETELEQGIQIQVYVYGKPVVSTIQMQGNESIHANDLISRLSITAGDSVSPDRLKLEE